jgi:hypothetical protein
MTVVGMTAGMFVVGMTAGDKLVAGVTTLGILD